jgi:putative peptidoglycan lipid II flippase
MRPMFISGVIMSGCMIVDQFMAVLAGDGAVAMINYGNRITLGLISVIAIFWTVLYPNFVKMAAATDFPALRATFWRFSMLGIIGLVPLCGLLAYFSKDLIMLLFERGAFTQNDTAIVAKIQSLYLMHIPCYALCMMCMRAVNAMENTNLLLIGNSVSLILNIGLNFYFIQSYGVLGVAMATLIAYCVSSLFWFAAANSLIIARSRRQ